MFGYPFGTIVLVILAAVIYFGFAQRALDRLYLTDKAALAIIVAMIIGGYIDIPIPFGGVDASVNVGGAHHSYSSCGVCTDKGRNHQGMGQGSCSNGSDCSCGICG